MAVSVEVILVTGHFVDELQATIDGALSFFNPKLPHGSGEILSLDSRNLGNALAVTVFADEARDDDVSDLLDVKLKTTVV